MTTVFTDTAPSRPKEALAAFGHESHSLFKRMIATPEFRVLSILLPVLALWGVAIATFGYPALIIPALVMVPVMFTVLMLITVGK
ncbi:MAG: hypothetical protein AB8B60_01500 [Sulfitobacter sp.]